MFEKKQKKEQSGFSVLSTEELYEINGGENGNTKFKLSEKESSRSIQSPSASSYVK